MTSILILDRDGPSALLMQRALSRHGYACQISTDPSRVDDRTALVVLDVEAASDVRAAIAEIRDRTAGVPVVLVTRSTDRPLGELAAALGAAAALRKPVVPRAFFDTVARLVGGSVRATG